MARRGGDWPEALKHWDEAQKWEVGGGRAGRGEKDIDGVADGITPREWVPDEDDAGDGDRATRSWRRAVGDTVMLWGLNAMARRHNRQ